MKEQQIREVGDGSAFDELEDYQDALRELGGEATAKEISNRLGKHYSSSHRRLTEFAEEPDSGIEKVEPVPGRFQYRFVEVIE